MADVSFDEEPTYRYAAAPNTLTKRGGLSGLLIRSKIANDERGAQYVLIVIAVVAILAAVFIFIASSKSATKQKPLPPGVVVPGYSVK